MIFSAFVSLKHPDGRKHTMVVTVTETSPERAYIEASSTVDQVVAKLDTRFTTGWRVEDLFLVDQTIISVTS